MGKASIVLWSGKAWESWGPPSIATGIGGSETAVIQMAKFLVKLGHDVRVIGDHEGYEGLNDGATWIHYEKALQDPKFLECDVLISSRDKRIVRITSQFLPVGAVKKTILWCHDIHCGDDWELDLKKFDKFFCLSDYAKKTFKTYYPYLSLDNIIVTRNGLDPERFSNDRMNLVRSGLKSPRFTYSSSPDRGLDILLGLWPRIRQIRDDAELHVYYGFKIWESMVAARKNDKHNALKLDYLKSRVMNREESGIFYHNRVGQQELADSYMRSDVWAHPTAFMETYCITALEAQAAGCTPVTTAIGALNETVKYGHLINPPNTSIEYQDKFVDHIEKFLSGKVGNALDAMAYAMKGRHWALTQTWESLASEWSSMFEQFLAEGKPL